MTRFRAGNGISPWGATRADVGFVAAAVAVVSALMVIGLWLEVMAGVA